MCPTPCARDHIRAAVWSLSHVWLFATSWTVAHQAPLSMGFSRHEYWSGLPFPSLFQDQRSNPCLWHCRRFFTTEPPGKPQHQRTQHLIKAQWMFVDWLRNEGEKGIGGTQHKWGIEPPMRGTDCEEDSGQSCQVSQGG